MIEIAVARRSDPLLICGFNSASVVEADFFLSAVREFGRVVPEFVRPDDRFDAGNFAGSPMLVVAGWEARALEARVLEDFRTIYPEKPTIVIGRKNDPDHRKEAFVKGADNFIGPDCSQAEIRAKAGRLWRLAQIGGQSGGMQSAPIRLRSLEIWLNEMVVLQNGRRVQLSRRELRMLIYLAKEHPASVSRQTLEREVFGCRSDPGTNVVAVHVHRLRKKISPDGDLLRTTPGGYQLN